MLSLEQLHTLYKFALTLGIEPLVEVNNAQEMEVAIELGAKVIGVNNRNLHNFEVDMETTTKLVNMVPQGTILVALSGIKGREDVERYVEQGVGGVLVGELLCSPRTRGHSFADCWACRPRRLPPRFWSRSVVSRLSMPLCRPLIQEQISSE